MALHAPIANAQSGGDALAIVDGRSITAADVDRDIEAKLRPLQMQIYALRKSALESLIARAILQNEARRRNITLEELRKQLTAGPVSVSIQDIEKSYTENTLAFGSMSPDEARERVRLDLEATARMKNYQDAVNRLRDETRIDVLLEEPKVTVSLAGAARTSKGSEQARVTIVEFADFECPYCRGAAPIVTNIERDYDKDVRVVFKHLPLQGHPAAFPAARAAVCAAEQGRFWQYHDALFAEQPLTEKRLNALAAEVGLDPGRFSECLTSQRSSDVVVRDMEEAKRLGITGTPTFIVNGSVLPGAVTSEQLRKLIDRELSATRSTSLNP
jgi:protein-disulfide isomerase